MKICLNRDEAFLGDLIAILYLFWHGCGKKNFDFFCKLEKSGKACENFVCTVGVNLRSLDGDEATILEWLPKNRLGPFIELRLRLPTQRARNEVGLYVERLPSNVGAEWPIFGRIQALFSSRRLGGLAT